MGAGCGSLEWVCCAVVLLCAGVSGVGSDVPSAGCVFSASGERAGWWSVRLCVCRGL